MPTEEETIAERIMWTVKDESVSEELRRRYESENEIVKVVLENSNEVMRALCLQNLVEPKDAPAALALPTIVAAAGRRKHWQITNTGKVFYAFITSNKKSIGVAWGSQAR